MVTLAAAGEGAPIRGLPFTRVYSHEDLGYVPRTAQLSFDMFGRLAVIHEGVYTVLNDNVWTNIAAAGDRAGVAMSAVIPGPDGRAYFGGRGSWGRAAVAADGLLHSISLAPKDLPDWTSTALFGNLLATWEGVLFASWNGVVYMDCATQRSQLFQLTDVSRVFLVGKSVYISCSEQPLRTIDLKRGTMETVGGVDLENVVVELAAPLDEAHTLVFLRDERLAVFDGRGLSPWLPQARDGLTGHVSALQRLVDGRMAVAITGRGLYIVSEAGELLLALTASEYHRITALANREAGVLWVATEDAIRKILYGSPFTTFGQRLGLTLGWPVAVSSWGRTFVASEGKLYEAVAGAPGAPSRFELQREQPLGGAWSLTARDPRMLVGSGKGIFSVESDGSFRPVGLVAELAHLVMIDAEHCYAVGRKEMAYFEWKQGRWEEAAPRIRGVPYPSVVHRVGRAVWIEMGGDGVARLVMEKGRLQLTVVKNAEWTKSQWVNVGSVDDTVVLSGEEGERRFFDEQTGRWCDAPELYSLLARSPYWIVRMQNDASGTIWGTHNEGVVRFAPNGTGYEIDASSFDVISDRYPIVRVLEGKEVWISAGQSLSLVDQAGGSLPIRTATPKLVSLVDARDGRELITDPQSSRTLFRLPFSNNSLVFRFISGSDGWRRTPAYEYRLAEDEPWAPLVGSQLAFRGLHEGAYRLQIRIADALAIIPFEVLAPWYRTRTAYALFGLGAMAALLGVIRGSSYVARRRNRVLETVVRERTSELKAAMEKLNEETRNAATRAERDRLASEIHDSLQQGLTGAILQLDTTMKLAAVAGDVRSRLTVARNMVSYARQEMQHAVWDMESPLLEGTELASALRNLTAFVDSEETLIEVKVTGEAVALSRLANHNLLRIAQEATTNALRHAKAKKIVIRLDYAPKVVGLEIADDGIGFCPDDVLRRLSGHFGLRGIRARTKKLGGTLNILSSANEGTTVRVEVPIDPNTSHPANALHDESNRTEED